jgi:hypothetical protein
MLACTVHGAYSRIIICALYEILCTLSFLSQEIDVDIWNRLLAVRNRKILKEEEVKSKGDVLTKMNEYMNRLITQDDLNRKKIEKALRSLGGTSR